MSRNFWRGFNAGDAAVLLFALAAAIASFAGGNPESYFFPRLASCCLLALCLLRAIAARGESAPANAGGEGRALPALLIGAAYLALADWLGFYASAGLAFFALSSCYAQNPGRGVVKRALLAAAVAAALFVIFAEVMGVQAPRGVLI